MSVKVAITGYSGFIGSNFIRSNNLFLITEVDLLNKKLEEVDFTGVNTVLHLAAIVHQSKSINNEQYFLINRDLAYQTAVKAKKQGVGQFIFLSSIKVYGESSNINNPFIETSICNPLDAYARSKFEAEQLISELEDNSFKVVIVRTPLVYGPGVKANMYNLIKLVDKFHFLPLGGIRNKRSIVYIDNLTAFIKRVIELQTSGIFIPADIEPLSTSQICNFIAGSFDKKIRLFCVPEIIQILLRKLTPSLFNKLFGSLVVNNNRSYSELNFIPPFSSEQGIKVMVDWYRNTKK